MIKARMLITLFVGIIIFPSLSFSATIFRVDMDANATGLQRNLTVLPGETYTSSIELILGDGDDSISSFSYSFWWDNEEIGSPTNITTSAFEAGWLDLSYLSQDDSHIFNFGQINVLGDSAGTRGPAVLTTFDWTVKNPVDDDSADIMPGFYNLSDSAFDKNQNSFTPEFQGGSIAVAPEPVSSVLFLSGGTLFMGRRFLKIRGKV